MQARYFLLLPLVLSQVAFASNFIGTYHCNGFDPYLNKKYAGTVKVEQQNAVYKITMLYDTGEKYLATGGQYNEELLSVVFQQVGHLKVVGLEQYHLSEDKNTMGGYWVYLGKDKLGSEVCTRDTAEIKPAT